MLAQTRVTRVTCPQITINNQRLCGVTLLCVSQHSDRVTLCHTHHCAGAALKMDEGITPRPHTGPDIAPLPFHAQISETYQWFTLVKLII